MGTCLEIRSNMIKLNYYWYLFAWIFSGSKATPKSMDGNSTAIPEDPTTLLSLGPSEEDPGVVDGILSNRPLFTSYVLSVTFSTCNYMHTYFEHNHCSWPVACPIVSCQLSTGWGG